MNPSRDPGSEITLNRLNTAITFHLVKRYEEAASWISKFGKPKSFRDTCFHMLRSFTRAREVTLKNIILERERFSSHGKKARYCYDRVEALLYTSVENEYDWALVSVIPIDEYELSKNYEFKYPTTYVSAPRSSRSLVFDRRYAYLQHGPKEARVVRVEAVTADEIGKDLISALTAYVDDDGLVDGYGALTRDRYILLTCVDDTGRVWLALRTYSDQSLSYFQSKLGRLFEIQISQQLA
jgi:hypothetical protein